MPCAIEQPCCGEVEAKADLRDVSSARRLPGRSPRGVDCHRDRRSGPPLLRRPPLARGFSCLRRRCGGLGRGLVRDLSSAGNVTAHGLSEDRGEQPPTFTRVRANAKADPSEGRPVHAPTSAHLAHGRLGSTPDGVFDASGVGARIETLRATLYVSPEGDREARRNAWPA
jgi:hypothetical protein